MRVILLPSLQTCLDRNRARGNVPLLTDDLVAGNYRGFVEGIGEEHRPFPIDNSHLSPDETVDKVEAIITRHIGAAVL